MMKPSAVAPDARVAVISPASSSKPERLARGIEALRARGYDAEFGKYAQGRQAPYFSGTSEQRLADLHAAFADPEVQAIFCTRGGYGSNYLLEDIDLDLIRDNPKPLFGYSDMTAVQTWILDELGLVAFHGPMVAADFAVDDGVHDASFDAALDGDSVVAGTAEGLRILRSGRAQGVMYGGCLSILTAGKLLFLEDVGAKPYQIDRMLRQMVLGGKFDGVTGFVFGEMLECASPGTGPELLEQVILRVLDWFDGPIAIGLRSGHVSRSNVTLPFGIEAELVLEDEPVLQYLEPAVQVD